MSQRFRRIQRKERLMKILQIGLVLVMVNLFFLSGCGEGSKAAYVGQWKATAPGYDRPNHQLSILADGTYLLRAEGGKGMFDNPIEKKGRWKIDKDGLVLYVGESHIPEMICQRDGKRLVDRLRGELVWERK
jgi:hypothetical protein